MILISIALYAVALPAMFDRYIDQLAIDRVEEEDGTLFMVDTTKLYACTALWPIVEVAQLGWELWQRYKGKSTNE